ncbi:hypothetical protein HS048_24715 [Planomonospora sp. ID91781]|uniref:hypothetical protein n=1 Tax=Planomonospora sp. ID91781 TaxID=2738135 RepID=UPI0018C37107|nr:hypothetical protein [Planomonospora sp. ID91781]MBG0823925.1 hypothetical protein [Planomonospora sp. ID91781]
MPREQEQVPAARSGTGMAVWTALCLLVPGALLVWLVVTIVGVVTPELGAALGRTGTPGTATVVSCESYTVGTGRSKRTNRDCEARFVPDEQPGQSVVAGTVPDVEVGEVFPAVLTPEGDRVLPTRARGVWRALFQLAALPFGLVLIAFLSALMMRARKATVWTGALGLPLLVVMVVGFLVGT